ncbi:MAG: sigma-70 family RNA polymerase sigma factor [Myxococcaceae bacterium]|nr:sigma-70 family RNA polymerase sigma factor [Myxococcaceae bacterium]
MSRRFETTRWSLILTARQGTTPEAREALSALCEIYWYPLYAFIRRKGHAAEDASDRVQGFFARLLEKNQIAVADRQRGRFRSWLLASLQHYLANEWDRESALKRGGGQLLVPLDATAAEDQYRIEPSHELTPERLFERRWALALLERVLNLLRDECTRAGKGPLFGQLKDNLAGEGSEASYQQLAAALGSTPGAVKVAAHRLRRRYRELLREEIAQTVSGPEDIDDELRRLLEALG